MDTKDRFQKLLAGLRCGKLAETGADYLRRVEWVRDLKKAEVVTSLPKAQLPRPEAKGPDAYAIKHTFMVDIDHPCYLVPSTTEGHYHLYIDVPGGVGQEAFFGLLRAMVAAGIVEPGYAEASIEQGHTSLRPPWRKKESSDGKARA